MSQEKRNLSELDKMNIKQALLDYAKNVDVSKLPDFKQFAIELCDAVEFVNNQNKSEFF